MRSPKFPKTVEASKHVSRSLWDLADALAEEVPAGSPLTSFEEAAEELVKFDGEPYASNTLRLYRDTAVAWPRDARASRVSFRGHQTLNGSPDRFEKIKDVRTAREAATAAGHKPWDRSTRQSTQERVEAVREALTDPDVATAAASDATVRSSFSKASQHVDEERERQSRENLRRENPSVAQFYAETQVLSKLTTAEKYVRAAVSEVLSAMSDESIDEDARERALLRVSAIEDMLDQCKSSLRGGSVDEALAALLSEGGKA